MQQSRFARKLEQQNRPKRLRHRNIWTELRAAIGNDRTAFAITYRGRTAGLGMNQEWSRVGGV